MAWIAVSIVPWAVITTTVASARISRIRASAARPSTPGIRTSRKTRSKGSASNSWIAPGPSLTEVTSYPACLRPFSRTQRRLSSSSAIRTRAVMASGSARPASLVSFGDREEAGHDGATPRVALHLDGAAVLLEDPVADGEPEPEALVFRGEERVEDPRTYLRGDPGALVHHLGLDHAPLSHAEVDLAEEGVEAHAGRERQPPAGRHGVDRVAHEVVKHLDELVLVAEDRRQARVVAPHQRDLALAARFLVEHRDALQELVKVERHQAQLDGPRQVEQHLDDPVHAVDLGEEHVRVLGEPRVGPELTLQELDGAPDRAERVSHLVGEADRHAAGGGERLAAPHLGLELADPGEVAQHGDGALDAPVAREERRGDEAHGHPPVLAPVHEPLRLRAALSGGDRLAEAAHDGGVGRKDLLEVAALDRKSVV